MKNIYVKIKWFIKEEWKLYVFMFFLLVSISLISLLPARVLGGAIDTIISGGITTSSLAMLVGALILLPITRYLLSMVYNYLMNV